MSMTEVVQRKDRINAAIANHDPVAFVDHIVAWLEATANMRVLPGLKKVGLEPQSIPELTYVDLREESVRNVADDAVMAFCISAGLAGDLDGFSKLHDLMTRRLGLIYPGSSALAHCNQVIDPIVTLDDAVGQVLKAMLEGKRFDAAEIWNAGLRVLQRLRSSNFAPELARLAALWLRTQWQAALADPQAFAVRDAAFSGMKIEAALADPRNDQAFIAALLLASIDAIEREVDPQYRTQLKAIAERH